MDGELYDSCVKKDLTRVQTILLCGGNPCNILKGMGETAIHVAASYDDDSTVILDAIISSGKVRNIDTVDSKDRKHTPLLSACYIGNVKCAKMLVENGADVRIKNAHGSSVIQCAAYSGNSLLVEECLTWNGVNMNHQGRENMTALMYACDKGHVDVVRVLLTAGADISLKNQSGYPAAWYSKNNEEISRLLIDHSNPKKQNTIGLTSTADEDFQHPSISTNSSGKKEFATLNSFIKRVLPDSDETKIQSIIDAIEDTGINLDKVKTELLLLLEPSDFKNVLKSIEARLLIKAIKEEYGEEKVTVVNF